MKYTLTLLSIFALLQFCSACPEVSTIPAPPPTDGTVFTLKVEYIDCISLYYPNGGAPIVTNGVSANFSNPSWNGISYCVDVSITDVPNGTTGMQFMLPGFIQNVGPFFIAFGTTLAIDVASFDATVIDQEIELEWEIANSENIQSLEILKSADGQNFTTIDVLEADELNHFYTDSNQHPIQNNYYKLKVQTWDNHVFYSEIIHAISEDEPEIQVFPNPASEFLHIKNLPENALIKMYNMDGQMIKTFATNSEQISTIPVADLPHGLYILNIESAKHSYAEKISLLP